MRELGHGIDVVGYVFSAHIFGMYGLAPLTGWIADRLGRIPSAMAGASILVVATVLAALSRESLGLLFPALFLLGWGWNFGLISGSALLTESVPAESRVTVQGTADMLMTICGGMAGLSSGIIKGVFSYEFLGNLGTAASLAMFGAALALGIAGRRQRLEVPLR
jgi:MFS family permease